MRADVAKAVFGALGADTTLKTLCPDGVWKNQAPQGKTRFVVVILADANVDDIYQAQAFWSFTYSISAVMKNNSSADAYAAADRIDAAIQGITTVQNHVVTVSRLEEPIDYSEPDPTNPDLFWQHVGGNYELMVTPA